MGSLPFYLVDSFTNRPFGGNPAGVVVVDRECDAAWMQAVAAEMKHSETAFLRKLDDGYELRWFTPAVEVDLCGHATLASAHALWSSRNDDSEELRFHTRSGVLTASRIGDRIELDFPATPPNESEPAAGLLDALGVTPTYIGRTTYDAFLALDSEETLRTLTPDFVALKKVDVRGIIVTSASNDPQYDFISRFFAPACGIDEDPVTGSAHCALCPYWSERLDKQSMTAYQASERGGVVYVSLQGERVTLGGQAVTVLEGRLTTN